MFAVHTQCMNCEFDTDSIFSPWSGQTICAGTSKWWNCSQDSGYITEVHHITAEGEDAGVVYCEVQGCENTGERRCHLEMSRAMYPGHCGYKSATSGVMKNLRDSTDNIKVHSYYLLLNFLSCATLLFNINIIVVSVETAIFRLFSLHKAVYKKLNRVVSMLEHLRS